MRSADVIVVGAGAAGLMSARQLSAAGKSVIILEGRDRAGGRICTIEEPAFLVPAEAGAEFIHGNLPTTLRLLKEAGIDHCISSGDSWRSEHGELVPDEDDLMGDGDLLIKKLRGLKEDVTVASFLESHFQEEEHAGLRQMVKGFVEGYDAADINRASVFTLRKEWQEMDEGSQYRVGGGYIRLIRFLEHECRNNGCFISFAAIVKEINWKRGRVDVVTATGERYTAKKIIVTVPLGVLCADSEVKAAIKFSPSVTDQQKLFETLGYGGVIKIMMLFNHAFWKALPSSEGKDLKDIGWLFSEECIPTWWTQAPDHGALLTGWLAGPKAQEFKDADDSTILHRAMESVCNIFKLTALELSEMLAYSTIVNWLADPFSLGAYSYATPQTHDAVKQLASPVENTVFFAGEAFYDGPEIGTVEAALANGQRVAKTVIDNY